MTSRANGVFLEDLIQRVNKVLWLPRSPAARSAFSVNLSIVALGIRAAYLVDSFSPDQGEKSLQQLLKTLRQVYPCFEDVRVVYAAEHQQYFFVNMPMLRERVTIFDLKESSLQSDTAFVLLDRTEALVPPSSDIIQTVRQIAESFGDPIPLPEDLTPKTLIPLSGFLLEYPVAYVPSSDTSSSFLGDVPLDVYECTIVAYDQHAGKTAKEHTLLKFSCPAHLAASSTLLKPSRLIEELEQRFRSRLKDCPCSTTLKIKHSVVTQDRVAL